MRPNEFFRPDALATRQLTAGIVANSVAANTGYRLSRVTAGDLAALRLAMPAAAWRHIARTGIALVTQADLGSAVLVRTEPGREALLRRQLASPALRGTPILLASPEQFATVLMRDARSFWMRDIILGLTRQDRALSVADKTGLRQFAACVAALMALAGALLLVPQTATVTGLVLSCGFLVWIGLRLLACLMPTARRGRLATDAELPPYTVLIALYREENMVLDLLRHLRQIDYPPHLLDIKLVVEEDDAPMHQALRIIALPAHVSILSVPPLGPRTKPKALCAALPFARGRFVAVYDAEDRPHPQQLREAVARFHDGGLRLACVQAPLVVENPEETAISRFCTAEYANLFGVLVPALAFWDMPIPLGGTSNHFRREALDASGGWDPFNVTEDADLGIRLARDGWQVGTITRPTFETSVLAIEPWLRQRTRWFKGWLQTLCVLCRHPVIVLRQLGARGTFSLAGTLIGTLASGLFHPLSIVGLVAMISRDGWTPATMAGTALAVFGYASTAIGTTVGLRRIGRPVALGTIAMIPLYWLLLSWAAWRALRELYRNPHHWDKTDHQAPHFPAIHTQFARSGVKVDRLTGADAAS